MKLIIGLGNVGIQYAHTRHNIGWDAVQALADKLGVTLQDKRDFKAAVAKVRVDGETVLLAQPLTFMNLSGKAVLALMQFYKIDRRDILLVHDDMDFPCATISLIKQGGTAGHNGVASVQELLGSDDIARLRIGIGRPITPMSKEDFVLQTFSDDEVLSIKKSLKDAVQAMNMWITQGLDKTMNSWNGVR